MSMAARMGIAQRDGMGLPTSEFIRLQRPTAAFSLVHDLVEQGGLGGLNRIGKGQVTRPLFPKRQMLQTRMEAMVPIWLFSWPRC